MKLKRSLVPGDGCHGAKSSGSGARLRRAGRWGALGWLCLAALLGMAGRGPGQTFTDAGFVSELITTLDPFGPVGVAWAPDGRMFIWQKDGMVRVFKNGALLGTPFLDFSAKVNLFNDNGMWGLAFDPDFAANGYVYLTYVFEPAGDPNDSSPKIARLVRVTANPANPDVMLAGSEIALLDNLPNDFGTHSLGTIRFAKDGKIFVGNGDGASPGSVDLNAWGSQDLDNVRGKMFRLNPDGTAPSDNPFYDGTDSVRSKIYCYGLRNPYRFSLLPSTGEPFIADVGWNDWEEIDHGVRGGNFGWPCFEGTGEQSLYQAQLPQCAGVSVIPPILEYSHSSIGTCIVGGDFCTSAQYPEVYRGNYFFADYSGNWIRRLSLDTNGALASVTTFASGLGAPVCVEQGPDGFLYYVSFSSGQVRRIRFNGPSASAVAAPSDGYSPLPVQFSSAGSTNGGGGTLTYLWDFGDGATSTQPNPAHTYTASAVTVFTAKLTVANANKLTSTATILITVGSVPPVPSITAPVDGTGVMPGQTVFYQGSATDADDGVLAGGALSWTVLLHHNQHVHAFVVGSGEQGSFVAENHGAIGTFAYEIVLTARDSSGLTTSTNVHVPVLADTIPPSTPVGLHAASASASQIHVSWNAAVDNAAVAGYALERCQGVGCGNFAPAGTVTGTNVVDSGLVPSTTYNYRLRAVDASGNLSDYSDTATATTFTLPPPPPGLVAAYGFSEGTGLTTLDASGHGQMGTLVGASWSAQGRFGNALLCSGAGYVSVDHTALLGLTSAMTLEAWVYPTVAGQSWQDVIYKATDIYYLTGSSSPDGVPASGGTFATSAVRGVDGLPLDTWTHLASTYDGATIRLYVNGVQVASRAQTGAIRNSTGPLTVGGDGVYGQFWAGLIDEVRIYNRALTAAELQSDMGKPVDTSVNQSPVAMASASPLSGEPPLTVNFSSAGSSDPEGAVLDYQWTFGDGASSTLPYPSHTYLSAGTFAARLTVSDGLNSVSSSNLLIAVGNQPPVVAVSAVPSSGTAPLNVAFSSAGSFDPEGASLSYDWTFGDGSGSSVASPAHLYVAPGVYQAMLTVSDGTNIVGSSNLTISVTSTLGALVAAYGFEEASGATVNDISGHANSGTINNATRTSSGRFGKALVFDGSSAWVSVDDSASLDLTTGMTLEAWVYPTTTPTGWGDIIYKVEDIYFLEGTSSQSGTPTAGGTFVPGGLQAPSALPVNTWTHLATTYDGAALRLYVNGVQVASQAQSGLIQTSVGPLTLGGDPVFGQFWEGRIDEVRIYNRALSSGEITNDMNTAIGTTPLNQPPVAAASAVPTNGVVPLIVSFSSAGSFDPEGAALGYSWSLGDGTFSTQANPTHTYHTSGVFIARLTVSDGVKSNTSANVSIVVTNPPINLPPTAVAGASVVAGVNPLTVRFTGTNSSDPEGLPLTFSWDFGDGSALSPSANPTHTFTLNGQTSRQFATTLTVTDSGGNPAQSSVPILVTNSPPTITSIPSQTVRSGQTLGPLGFTVGDFETSAANLLLNASSSNPLVVQDAGILFGGTGSNRTVSVTPVPGQIGLATVTLRVSDGLLASASAFDLSVIDGSARLTILDRAADGVVHLRIHGVPDQPYALQSSADLTLWQTLTTVSDSTGVSLYTDTQAAGQGARFYRLVESP